MSDQPSKQPSNQPSEQKIRAVLAQIAEPNMGTDIVSAEVVEAVHCNAEGAEITLAFPYAAASAFAGIVAAARAKLAGQGLGEARFSMRIDVHAHTVQGGVERLPGVKNIIAVASAKGGVGKSTTAANLALALAHEGATVGLLDADIYGPSLPVMLGVRERPQGSEDGGIAPLRAHGLQLMSIGFVVEEEQPMVWRGPMATRALVQLLRDTRWQAVDYLVLDMPPGTGDIQLTIAQQIPVTGALVVTTPQELAVADARRGLVMFNKVSIPVLGVVENMSRYHCPQYGHESPLFGEGGGAAMCKAHEVELLGQLPLHRGIREAADGGAPSVAAEPEGDIARSYRRIAVRAAAKIAAKSRDRSAAFPKIVVSD